ncbi:EamA family transporter [Thalassospira sp. MA62]|nr:EamA family transporter [Thalassospira sp. MA62]
MSLSVFLVVLAAAAMHAVWNALVKGGPDKLMNMTAVVMGHTPIVLILLPFVNVPAPESWPYLFGSMGLHIGYQLFLILAYRLGDLSQVYPIARGSSPLIVATVSVLLLGVTLHVSEWIAIVVIAVGILSMCITRQADGLHNRKAALAAIVTGCFISSYSLVDGTGARLAGSALDYYTYQTIGNIVIFGLIITIMRPRMVIDIARSGKKVFLIGGTASFVAYATVMWAFTQAPIPLVVALRETSIVFALLIGVFFMGERLNLVKLSSTMMTLGGAIILRLARSL